MSPSPPSRRSRFVPPNPANPPAACVCRAVACAPRVRSWPRRRLTATSTCIGLQRAQLTLSLLALVAFGAIFGVLPIALYLVPALRNGCNCWVCRWRCGSWSCRCCPCSARSAGSMRGAPTPSTTPSANWSSVDRRAVRRGCCDVRHPRTRHLGRALRAHDLRPAGRQPHGDPVVERRGDLRRVPVGRELPRDRRPRDADRRERAVAVARLHRRLPGAAAVRGGAAASLRLLHDPRLCRGAPAQPGAAVWSRLRSCW